MCGATREWTRRSGHGCARRPAGRRQLQAPGLEADPSRKLYPLNEALDSPAYGRPNQTWRESLIPGLLSTFRV